MISKYNSLIGQWVDVKKNQKDTNGNNIIWKGNLESVSDNGCNLWNGQSSAGGFSEVTTILWSDIQDITPQQNELVVYFVG